MIVIERYENLKNKKPKREWKAYSCSNVQRFPSSGGKEAEKLLESNQAQLNCVLPVKTFHIEKAVESNPPLYLSCNIVKEICGGVCIRKKTYR